MPDVSIEYAHIYTNQRISEEHKLSLETLQDITDSPNYINKSKSLVVMVDDYSFPDSEFDYENFLSWLELNNFVPDLIVRESQLIPACDNVLSVVSDEKLRKQLEDYIGSNKYPCSLFIATWYLLRLGEIQSSVFPANLVSKELLNILPKSFKPFEKKGLDIIANTPYAASLPNIHYVFLPKRRAITSK
ncbi:hypothetical protein HGB25_00645 [Candidatus Saccharibacteria bacterium]|nr:hypothetical protein [Candidatus Saccharibacteria bacterium]